MDFQSVFQGKILTIGAGASGSVTILESDELYKNVCIGVIPIQDAFTDFLYTVEVYLAGSRIESNTCAVTGVFQTMYFHYTDAVYPPNINWITKAGLQQLQYKIEGFRIVVYNANPETRDFEVYSSFEQCLGGAYRKLK